MDETRDTNAQEPEAQDTESTTESSFFDGEGWDDLEDSGEESSLEENKTVSDSAQEEPAENQTEEPQKKEAEDQPFTVKFNGQQMAVSKDDAVAYIQKGMNYDHLKEKLDGYEQDEGVKIFKEMAKESGVSSADYVKRWRNALEQGRLQNLQNKGYSKEAAAQIVEKEKEVERLQRQVSEYEETINAGKAEADRAKAQQEQFRAFREAYPDVKADAIPQEVYDEAAKGKDLVNAYTMWENKKLKDQLKAEKTNAENAKRAPTSTQNGIPQKKQMDAFSTAFWAE